MSHREYYNRQAEISDPTDFFKQVKHTINGVAIGEEHVDMMVAAIRRGLAIEPEDVLLDLCCGNGALTDRLFRSCRGGLGVDISERLIEIAQRNFERSPACRYLLSDAERFVESAEDGDRFTKVLCFGAFQLLDASAASAVLQTLRERFNCVQTVFIGDLPDKELMHTFIRSDVYVPGFEDDSKTPFGMWRTEAEFRELAAAAGWAVSFSRMPREYYGAAYRYNAKLVPA